MRLSTRSRYGTRLMLDLAQQQPRRSVQLKEISERQGISLKYLEQLMMPLKKARLVASSRGNRGGYRLARKADEISIGEIVSVLEMRNTLTECESNPGFCERAGSCSVRDLWVETTDALYDKLNGVRLADLLSRVESSKETSPARCPGLDRRATPPEKAGGRVRKIFLDAEEPMKKIVSIAVSTKKGTRKTQVDSAEVVEDQGLRGDAHAGPGERQISFLAGEQISLARAGGLQVDFGDFAENVATEGVDWKTVPVGTPVRLGDEVVVEITRIGKECHKKCAIYYQAGDCIMPREGVFGKVVSGGTIRCGDRIRVPAP